MQMFLMCEMLCMQVTGHGCLCSDVADALQVYSTHCSTYHHGYVTQILAALH